MSREIVLLTPGAALRILITASGYRPCFNSRGLDKDLDDLGLEKRPGSNFELLQDCQAQWLRAIREDCGADWSNLIDSAWHRHSSLLRLFARDTDTTAMIPERAREALLPLLIIPELSGFIRRASREIPLLDLKTWWEVPFVTWLQVAASQSGLPAAQLRQRVVNHLDIDERTLDRWQQGESIGLNLWPYRVSVQALLTGSSLTAKQVERLTGWLVMAVALQSLSAELRDSIKRDFHMHDHRPLKSEQQVREQLKREAADRSSLPLRDQVAPVLADLDRMFADARGNQRQIRDRLDWLQALYERGSPLVRAAHEYLWSWLSARLAANLGEKDKALELYATACKQAWWRAGPNQHAILREALCYAVGVGDKVGAKHYWDKCYLLGLNNPPQLELDEQVLRRLSFEFERLFAPQKAAQRIPPAMRVEMPDKPFSPSSTDLKKPNALRKYADGRVRYTPLMNAVLWGELEHVKRLVQAGGDPNVFIPESGENALIMALRRAYERKDPEIFQYLLTLDISPETANRPASTKRETPLQIAMNMADSVVVDRLIALGANVEQACFTSPSALVYAMALLHDSIHVSDPAQLKAYLEGRVPADAFDAKCGTILDCELSAQRQGWHAMLAEPRKKLIFEAVRKHFSGSANALREVVTTLLAKGADPNRRYADFNGHRDRWTPTLFAAQLGDLDVLKAMIAAGGDPWASLEEDDSLSEKNALWVAVAYQRHTVVEHLLTLLPQRLWH
ncbi:ankyrin repeat domain-containing protein [Stutzerimonas stutzeri]|uniref:Ankyrin repeat domain-containing protein n=2 Tax=Stutzerimonas stutzeri group TaxID=136846 RepID=A0A9X7V252_9GAMM|nr:MULTISPECIES: ankyrin repeat domain-containing protein [Stutzerimonas stutzeri group]QPT30970.1 ankyrin repeat domain-containing protein [Stutzerimonas stutzeri]QQN50642.1 ankyrin repeat domain-containing protein [Stutzerimonas balearica]